MSSGNFGALVTSPGSHHESTNQHAKSPTRLTFAKVCDAEQRNLRQDVPRYTHSDPQQQSCRVILCRVVMQILHALTFFVLYGVHLGEFPRGFSLIYLVTTLSKTASQKVMLFKHPIR
jgi:hypothetical protein